MKKLLASLKTKDLLTLESNYQSIKNHPLYTTSKSDLILIINGEEFTNNKDCFDSEYKICLLEALYNAKDLSTLEKYYQIAKSSSAYSETERSTRPKKYANAKREIDNYYLFSKNYLLYDLKVTCQQCQKVSFFKNKEISGKLSDAYCKKCKFSKTKFYRFSCPKCKEAIKACGNHTCQKKEPIKANKIPKTNKDNSTISTTREYEYPRKNYYHNKSNGLIIATVGLAGLFIIWMLFIFLKGKSNKGRK